MRADKVKSQRRTRRKRRIRKAVHGTAQQPRLTVFRSHKHIYAQIIDDDEGATLCAVSTRTKAVGEAAPHGGNIAAAKLVGAALAERAKTKGIQAVCFDRNGYRFHGRVKSLAQAAREGGLTF